tara:strand:- start:182 stop:595 length:414 start_codon:yes stop_codon:yes gene_type:complete
MKIIHLILLAIISIAPNSSLAEDDPIINELYISNTGLSGNPFNYPKGESEIRILKVIFPVGTKSPVHTYPAPMMVYMQQGVINHYTGNKVRTFKAGDAWIESNFDPKHYIESTGNVPAVLLLGVSTVKGLPLLQIVD